MYIQLQATSNINSRFSHIRMVSALLVALSACVATSALAAPTASGEAFDLSVNVSVLALPVLSVAAQNEVHFSNSIVAYADVSTTPSFDTGPSLTARLQTGTLDAETAWDPGEFMVVGSSATANNVQLGVGVASLTDLLTLGSTVIRSTSIVSGSCPIVSGKPSVTNAISDEINDFVYRSGFETQTLAPTTTTENPLLTVSVENNPLATVDNPAANTSIDIKVGSLVVGTLILHEQVISGDGITSSGTSANGLHLNLNIAGLITANVIIAHSEASIACN